VPVLVPFHAYRFPVPPEELAGLAYVPGEEPPRAFGGSTPVQDSGPALFVYHQRFRLPGDTGESIRAGIMGLLNRSDATVFTHEETCPDRVSACASAMHSAETDLGSLWLWCGDRQGSLRPLLEPAGSAFIEFADRFGCLHQIWRVGDPARIHMVQQALAAQPLFLADGHHRYAGGWNLATVQIRTPALLTRAGAHPFTDIDTIERNARARVLFPPKSTDFFPKLAAGLVMHRHRNDSASPPVARLGA
jgi:uncharacterized protein (DUF1015 family)